MATAAESAPGKIQVLEHGLWIPLESGIRLAARLWLPADAQAQPVPALLEFLPYRKRDLTRARDEPIHAYFASHGYASIRVDLRGSGDSFGTMRDEYEAQEQADALEVIAWLAAQPWCSGAVGMFGVSWGGFNALQVAALRPPALKAIVTSCSTDDRYSDDMHYMGGCLLVDNLDWGNFFLSILPMPGDPEIMGPGWRDNWMERLQAVTPPAATWMEHPARDAYWKHGSISESYADIECPVMATGGWLDGYSNAVPRLLEHLRVPRIGIIGPHAHQFGFEKRPPGPAYGFLQVALQWWDRWLKHQDTGIDDAPMLRAYMFDDLSPAAQLEDCPGRWIAEPVWPPARFETRTLYLNGGGLQLEPRPGEPLHHASLQTVGMTAGKWCPYGTGGGGSDFAVDQRVDDALSLCFDGEPLAERLEILGAPSVELDVSVDRPTAAVAVRLVDVQPDGRSTRVTYGVLNLAHRDGSERPLEVVPGRRYRVRVRLNDIAYSFAPGHRLRVCLSTCYWPVIWPAPEAVAVSLHPGSSSLELPVRPDDARDPGTALEMPSPASARPPEVEVIEPPLQNHRRDWDLVTGHALVSTDRGSGLVRFPDSGIETGRRIHERLRINHGDPLSAEAEFRIKATTGRSGWRIEIDSISRLRADRECFVLDSTLEVREDGQAVLSRHWTNRIARNGR
jgi:predicted acyl esterase